MSIDTSWRLNMFFLTSYCSHTVSLRFPRILSRWCGWLRVRVYNFCEGQSQHSFMITVKFSFVKIASIRIACYTIRDGQSCDASNFLRLKRTVITSPTVSEPTRNHTNSHMWPSYNEQRLRLFEIVFNVPYHETRFDPTFLSCVDNKSSLLCRRVLRFQTDFLAISSNSALQVLRYSAIAISLLPAVALLFSPIANASEAFSFSRYCSILKRCWKSVSGCTSNCVLDCQYWCELEDFSDVFTRILLFENVSTSLSSDTASLPVTSATWNQVLC